MRDARIDRMAGSGGGRRGADVVAGAVTGGVCVFLRAGVGQWGSGIWRSAGTTSVVVW